MTDNAEIPAGESKDGSGAGDHDEPYWPRQRWLFKPFELAHLLMMRGRVQDHRAGVRGGPSEGDDDYVVTTPSGLRLPLHEHWRD